MRNKLIQSFFTASLLTFILLASATSVAQTVVFEETFDEVDGSTTGLDNTGGVNWNASCPDCLAGDYFEVLTGQMENNDSNGPAIFTTGSIPTSCDNIEICFDINLTGTFEGCFTGATGCNSTDYVALSYSIGGGPFQNPANAYDCPVSCAGLFVVWDGNAGGSFTYCSGLIPAGTDIALQITSQTWSGTEYIAIDNLTVTCYCTAPTLLITDPAPVCETSTVDLTDPAITAGSDAGNLTYWTDASATIALATPTAVGAGTYYIQLENGGCTTILPVTVSTFPEDLPTFAPIANVCQNDPAPVLPTTSTNGYTGTWAPVVSTATTGTTTYTFTPDPGQCVTSTTLDIVVDAPIIPTFDPVANVCQNDPAPALPTTSTNGFTGTWAPAVSTATAGTTTYTFTPDAGQCATATTLDITVDPQITPTFDPIANVCQGSTPPVIPTTSTNGITGSWAPAVSTATAGTTTYTFTPDAGQCATSTTLDITVDANTSLDPGTNGTASLCPGDPSLDLFNSLGGTPDIGGSWSPVLNSGTGLFNPAIDAFGTYTYTVGSGACTNTADVVVTQNAGFNGSENVDVCENTNYTYPDGSTELIIANTSHTSSLLTISGCDSIIVTNVNIIPSPNVVAGNDTTICEGESITLTGSGASTYIWDNNVTNGTSFTPSSTTTYTVIGTDQNGCFSGDQITVTIEPAPTVSFVADTLFGCAPLLVNFTNTTTNTSDCEWMINETTVTSCTPQYTFNAGSHSVTLTTTSTTGCTASVTYTNYINVSLNPTASFFPSSSEVSYYDSEILFNNTSENASSYEWNFGDNFTSTEENPIHSYDTEISQNYTVQLVASTSLGCTDTAYVTIQSIEELIYYIPNTFTPDGDEFNQVFEPIFTQGYDQYDVDFYIFNRWGELIWESHNTELGWDGTFRGLPVKSDTYIWKVEFKSSNNDERLMDTGHVNLLR